MAYLERIIILQLVGITIDTNLIQVYAPTADKQDDDTAPFYKQLRNAL